MTIDRPDFSQAVLPFMPVIGEGQVAWFQSAGAVVGATDTEDLINYVVPDDFELHVCSGVVSINFPVLARYDLRQTPGATWVSPTSHIDEDSWWDNPDRAYDGNVSTFALSGQQPEGWGSYLILLINASNIDKVRFIALYAALSISKVDIDLFYDGDWHDVYEGAFADRTWVEKAIGTTELVSKARVRFYNTDSAVSWAAIFYEFQFNTAEVTPQEGISFDTNSIIPYLPQAPYIVEAGATFAVRVYNDDDAAHTMSASVAGFLQKKV